MKTVPLNAVSIRRDAMTTLAVTIPAHELEVARLVFGEDNVQVTKEEAGVVEIDPDNEGDRLAQKYGQEPIAAVFGSNFKGGAARAISSYPDTAKPKGKAAAPA